ncbi:hypothetical protein PG993_007017 [Apiospora rasikravindrae]|uniref:Uncharacterized protein n=1 Tax=Apiospora rasikravindrae TaxID=990691 RepID=A0ABR1SWA3_9PEZI
MHFSSILVLAAPLAALAAALEAPIPGYRVEEMQWEVDVGHGQTESLNGTVEEVFARILEVNPEFQLAPAPAPAPGAAEARGLQPEKRGKLVCGGFPRGSVLYLNQGVNYLRGVPGRPGNGPGPGACGRVSCSYNSAIWWCNDNTFFKQLDSYDQIANSAKNTINKCAVPGMVSGQNFEDGKWNTIVRDGRC